MKLIANVITTFICTNFPKRVFFFAGSFSKKKIIFMISCCISDEWIFEFFGLCYHWTARLWDSGALIKFTFKLTNVKIENIIELYGESEMLE